MVKRTPVEKIVIATLTAAFIFHDHVFLVSCIGAAALIIYWVHQKTLDAQYPYDINAYLEAKSEDDRQAVNNVLSDFAASCPNFDAAICLSQCDCPDCPYGKNW